MCTTLPETLITVMGIEKVIPRFDDLTTMLTVLPRSSTGERMNPYTSIWTGTTAADGPRHFHLVLLDNGRTDVLADAAGRDALRCIRCSACLNVCPVYEHTGGWAYESTYPGPIGAVLEPQLKRLEQKQTLPFASSLCGACYEVCPVKIDIPSMLIHLRGKVNAKRGRNLESTGMDAVRRTFSSRSRYERAQRLARGGLRPIGKGGNLPLIPGGPLGAWLRHRELPKVADETFREWWRNRR
jgi:L-lactate dehydrogenase complex protein LldF